MTPDRRAHVRWAYERARWWRAAPWALPALLLATTAWLWGSLSAAVVGPALAVALVALRWTGGDLGRGAATGLLAGTLPFVLMVGWRCTGNCSPSHCAAIGIVSGIAASIALYRGLRSQSIGWAVAAVSIAAATSALPCFMLGVPGMLVVPTLLATSVVPAMVLRRA